MEKVKANKVLFIKLGKGASFFDDCVKDNCLRLDYREVKHELCLNKQWDEVSKYYMSKENKKLQTATNHSNQIRQFYEEDENTLWITFQSNKMWWCFSKPEITLLPDNTKTRPVIGKWSDKDIYGNDLKFSGISGKLLKTQGFRGTICSVDEKEYALSKINGEENKQVVEAKKALSTLKGKLSLLIKNLHWKDFEVLVDLIFRQAGWQRVGFLGEEQKTIDLDLFAPVTGERAAVQIKSKSNKKEFSEFQSEVSKMRDYQHFYFVVHTNQNELMSSEIELKTKLLFVEQVAELAISAGLVDWVIKKTS